MLQLRAWPEIEKDVELCGGEQEARENLMFFGRLLLVE